MSGQYDIIVIGGGASGITASVRAAERGRSVLLVDKGDRIGRKILASGNGRCNLLNCSAPKYYGQSDYACEVLRSCPSEDIVSFFRKYGLMISEETEGRMYPVTYQSSSVLSVLKNALNINRVTVRTGFDAVSVIRSDAGFAVQERSGETISSAKLIISCGGAAQPRLGGSGDGYVFLRSLGHSVLPVFPSLVPLEADRKSISGLSGIRIRCSVKICDEHHTIHRENGEILFTDYGVSGICAMQCARFTDHRKTHLVINFLHGIMDDPFYASEELKRRRGMYAGMPPVALLEGILPERISYAVMKQAGIPLRGERAAELSDKELEQVFRAATSYRVDITGTRGLEYAQVTAGGADCREFDPSASASLIIPGLYVTGELMNVDGDCGGYNLMFAFATGLLAGGAA